MNRIASPLVSLSVFISRRDPIGLYPVSPLASFCFSFSGLLLLLWKDGFGQHTLPSSEETEGEPAIFLAPLTYLWTFVIFASVWWFHTRLSPLLSFDYPCSLVRWTLSLYITQKPTYYWTFVPCFSHT
ncbi:hypothetical protein DL96DRAFT_1100863 [Flagelloscypha sp. PMI_526]|nr:hypothetical protein DL96DRAFT_1100863 [Flagelloscypha sp. PMI_526]